jgi:arginyl-tRNA synthetase
VTPAELSRVVLTAVRRAVDAAELDVEVPEKALVQRPPRPDCGDYATNMALRLAGPAGRAPREVAEILRRRLLRDPAVAAVEIAGGGFLNITLATPAYGEVVRRVREQGAAYGSSDAAADEEVTVAPAVPGAVRGTLAADVVNRLLRTAGARPAPPGDPYEVLVVSEPRPSDLDPADGDPEPGDGAHPDPGQGDGIPDGAVSLSPSPDGAPSPHRDLAQDDGSAPAGASLAVLEAAALSLAALEALLGPDAARWALLRPPAGDAPRLRPADRAALLAQREANPLFRVRYAHARTRALVRNARDLGVDTEGAPDPRDAPETPEPPGPREIPRPVADPETPETPGTTGPRKNQAQPAYHPAETELLGLLADYPRVVESAARRRAPDRIARHLERLADAFARFHDECPPLPKGDEKPSAVHAARIRLTDAAGIVLACGLRTLGIDPPERI